MYATTSTTTTFSRSEHFCIQCQTLNANGTNRSLHWRERASKSSEEKSQLCLDHEIVQGPEELQLDTTDCIALAQGCAAQPKSPTREREFDGCQTIAAWDACSYTTQGSSIAESFVKSVRVFSSGTNSWEIARVTFDTGSTYNWISKHFVQERLRIPVHTIPNGQSRTCVAFSGHVIVPLGFVKLVWYGMEGPGRSTYEAQFLVSGHDDHLFDMLVGSRTISREKILSWQITTVWPNLKLPILHGRSAHDQENANQGRTARDNEKLEQETRKLKERVHERKRQELASTSNTDSSIRESITASRPPGAFQTRRIPGRSTNPVRMEELRREVTSQPSSQGARNVVAATDKDSKVVRDEVREHWASGGRSKPASTHARPEIHIEDGNVNAGCEPEVKTMPRPQNASSSAGNLLVNPQSRSTSEESSNITSITNAMRSTPATSREVQASDQEQAEKLPDKVETGESQRQGFFKRLFYRKTKEDKKKGKGRAEEM